MFLKCTVNEVYNHLVELSKSSKNKLVIKDKSESKGVFEIEFGDKFNGLKFLLLSAFKEDNGVTIQTELYSLFLKSKIPIPYLHRKSAEKFQDLVTDYLKDVTNDEQVVTNAEKVITDNNAKLESEKVIDVVKGIPHSSENKKMMDVAKEIRVDSEKNKNNSLVILVVAIIIMVGLFFGLKEDKYSVCECQNVVNTTTILKSKKIKIDWCNRKYGRYTQRELIDKCATEIKKNMLVD